MAEVLISVPSRVLLEQFSEEFPKFCKVGTGYNDRVDLAAEGFIAVTESIHLLQTVQFQTILVDEAHHPSPTGMPVGRQVFKFSATHREPADFQYTMGEAIADAVLSDYDFTVPITTQGQSYLSLAQLLSTQAGHFRRVLAYCNSVHEARRFRHVLESAGLAAWHINGKTTLRKRRQVVRDFVGCLRKPVHILVTVQVLGEGVNIPNADTCLFVHPRDSYVSIIQAMGRVLRTNPRKPLAHVILPAQTIVSESLQAGCAEDAKLKINHAALADAAPRDEVVPSNTRTRNIGDCQKRREVQAVEKKASGCGDTVLPSRRWLSQVESAELYDAAGDATAAAGDATETDTDSATASYRSYMATPSKTSPHGRKCFTRRATHGAPIMLDQGYGSELHRFVAAISQADTRLRQHPLHFRASVVDVRMAVSDSSGYRCRDLLAQLSDVITYHDPWEVRLRSLERFVSKHDHLPRRQSGVEAEATLAHWLHNAGQKFKLRGLPLHRLQRLENSSCALLRYRVELWRDKNWAFRKRCEALNRYVCKHGAVPSTSRTQSRGVRQLGKWFSGLKTGNVRVSGVRLQLLWGLHPLVDQHFAECAKHPQTSRRMGQWKQMARALTDLARQHGRLPRDRIVQERTLFRWLQRQRLFFPWLPHEMKTLLLLSPLLVSHFDATSHRQERSLADPHPQYGSATFMNR